MVSGVRLTKNEFVNKARTVHGDTYSYDNVEYKNTKENVLITCKIHGNFPQSPGNHLSGKGCIYCAGIVPKTAEGFKTKARKVHGDTYDYSKVNYTTNRDKVEIICKLHGSFWQTPSNHYKGQGCPECGKEKRSLFFSDTTEEFVEGCSNKHNNKYDYSLVEYDNQNSIVKIICPIHGLFEQKAGNHKNGQGCPSCAIFGYKQTVLGSIYVLKCGDIVKVGITNKSVTSRAKQISKSYGCNFEIVTYMTFSDGSIPLTVETQVLKELKEKYKQPTTVFDGSTECFFNVCIPALVKRIGVIASEQF